MRSSAWRKASIGNCRAGASGCGCSGSPRRPREYPQLASAALCEHVVVCAARLAPAGEFAGAACDVARVQLLDQRAGRERGRADVEAQRNERVELALRQLREMDGAVDGQLEALEVRAQQVVRLRLGDGLPFMHVRARVSDADGQDADRIAVRRQPAALLMPNEVDAVRGCAHRPRVACAAAGRKRSAHRPERARFGVDGALRNRHMRPRPAHEVGRRKETDQGDHCAQGCYDASHTLMIAPCTVRRKLIRFLAWWSACAFPLWSCDPYALDLQAALARADARTFAACGRHADPSSVRLVSGYIDCANVRAVGCSWTGQRAIQLSRVLSTQAALERVATHEYLHLLGAQHVPAGRGIMGVDGGSQIDRVTAEDLEWADCPRPRAE